MDTSYTATLCNRSRSVRFVQLAVVLLSVLVAVIVPRLTLADSVPEPDGYRLDNYDDFVPDSLSGAKPVEAEQVRALSDSNAVIVDVIPEHRRPDNLPKGQIWIPLPHQGVPGSLWLPDVGYGVLSEKTEAYFKHHLNAATVGNKDVPLVFYCRDNCWMSWNAAKRAMTYGYTNVHWFIEGTDGWFEAGYEFQVTTPAPGERH